MVRVYHNLTKADLVGKLDAIYSYARKFELQKFDSVSETLAVGIVWIGFKLVEELNAHKEILEDIGYKRPPKSKDNTLLEQSFAISTDGKPVCINEHATRIASGPSTHVLQFDAWSSTAYSKVKRKHLKATANDFIDLVLEYRPGRCSTSFVYECEIEATYQFFRKCREAFKRSVFLFPYHLKEAGAWVQSYMNIEPSQIVIDNRTVEEKELAKENKQTNTFKR